MGPGSTPEPRKASPGRFVPRARPGHPARPGRSRTHTPRPGGRRRGTGRQPSRPGLLRCHHARRPRYSGMRGLPGGPRCRRCLRCHWGRARWIRSRLRPMRPRPIETRPGQTLSRQPRIRSWGWRHRWPDRIRLHRRGPMRLHRGGPNRLYRRGPNRLHRRGPNRLHRRGPNRLYRRGPIQRRPHRSPGPWCVRQQRGIRRSQPLARWRGRSSRPGLGRRWRWGWPWLLRRPLLRL
jgi:hypothetical protein